MADESATPTSLLKIYGDFDSRVRTASRKSGISGLDMSDSQPRRFSMTASRSAAPMRRTDRDRTSLKDPVAKLRFDDSNFLQNPALGPQERSRKRRATGALDDDDPLLGLADYPRVARRRESENRYSEAEQLKVQLLQKEADYVGLEARLKTEESTVKKLQVQIQREKMEREFECERYARERREDRVRIRNLEDQVKTLKERNSHAKEYSSMRLPRPDEGANEDFYPTEIQQLNEEINELKEEIFNAASTARQEKSDLEESLGKERQKASELSDQLESAKKKCEALSDVRKELTQVKNELAEAKLKLAEGNTAGTSENRTEERIRRQKLEHQSLLKKEIDNLRLENKLLNETADHSGLLQEQVNNLTDKLSQTEKQLESHKQFKETLVHTKRYVRFFGLWWYHVFYSVFLQEIETVASDVLDSTQRSGEGEL